MRKLISLFLSLFILSGTFLCIPMYAYAKTSIAIKKDSIKVGINETVDLVTLIDDDNIADAKYKYTSSDKKIVSVNSKGILKGKSKGNVKITIKSGSRKSVIKVAVKPAAKKLTLNKLSVKIGIGERINLDSKAIEGYSYARVYSSANKKIATVNSSGIVKGVKTGTVKIRVKSFNNKVATCKVTVCKAPESISITNANNVIQKGSNNHKISFKLSKGSASNKITYSIKNKKIASVNSDGYITGKKTGKTTVTVKTYNGLETHKTIVVKNDSLSLNTASTQIALDNDHVEKVKYGKSVQGRNLEGFVITNGSSYKKTLFMDFAVHGFEDSYSRDGKVLVKEANALIQYFSKHSDELGKFRLVIVPCANPDGTIAGKNNLRACSTAFGRCTARHVDINRDFGNFRGVETRKLRDFIKKEKPNVYLNMHGWLNEAIGTKKLNDIVCRQLGLGAKQNGVYVSSQGYAIGWVHKKYNIPSCLVEYKSPQSVSTSKDIKMIKEIIKAYS